MSPSPPWYAPPTRPAAAATWSAGGVYDSSGDTSDSRMGPRPTAAAFSLKSLASLACCGVYLFGCFRQHQCAPSSTAAVSSRLVSLMCLLPSILLYPASLLCLRCFGLCIRSLPQRTPSVHARRVRALQGRFHRERFGQADGSGFRQRKRRRRRRRRWHLGGTVFLREPLPGSLRGGEGGLGSRKKM